MLYSALNIWFHYIVKLYLLTNIKYVQTAIY